MLLPLRDLFPRAFASRVPWRFLLLLCCGAVSATVWAVPTRDTTLLVRFQARTTTNGPASAVRAAQLDRAEAATLRTIERVRTSIGPVDELLPALGVARVHVRGGRTAVAAALARLRQDPNVLYAYRDQRVQAFYTPNDPGIGYQWSLPRVRALEAWDVMRGSSSVVIGVLDTGVEATHPDLQNKLVLPGYNALDGSTNTNDGHGHGTHVSGIAAAATDNGVGVAGAGFNSRIVPVKVLGDSGEGSFSSIIGGIRWAADHGVKVINMSLGGTVDYPGEEVPLQDAVNYARERGVVVVAAAGNSGDQTRSYPGALENVICVASTNENDARSGFSSYGSWVDVGAPGSNILSSVRGGGYAYYSGTSMATPLVAGEAALLFGHAGLATSPDVIRDAIQNSQDAVADTTLPGRVNFRAALDRLPKPAPGNVAPAIENAGFETPFVGSGGGAYQYGPVGGTWLFDGGAGISGNGSGFTSGNPNAPQGGQVAFLQGDGSISQFVNNFQAGTRYTLTFQAAQRNYQASRQEIEVFVGAQSLGRFTPSGTAYSTMSVTFSASVTGGATLRFDGLNPAGGDNTAFIDDVRIVSAL